MRVGNKQTTCARNEKDMNQSRSYENTEGWEDSRKHTMVTRQHLTDGMVTILLRTY